MGYVLPLGDGRDDLPLFVLSLLLGQPAIAHGRYRFALSLSRGALCMGSGCPESLNLSGTRPAMLPSDTVDCC